MLRAVKWEEKYFPLPVLKQAQRIVAEAPEELTEGWLLYGVMSGLQHLWLIYDEDELLLAFFIQIRHYFATNYAYAEVIGVAGQRMVEALTSLPEIEEWARAQGARKIVVTGRRGWERALKDKGYSPRYVVLNKTLES